jgi:hypothetical protein
MNKDRLHPDHDPLPTESDFDPDGGNLDAQDAWSEFGGLSLAQAHIRFRQVPESYQEAFMCMGGKAFAFYYPVIDSYLREASEVPEQERCGREAWILAKDIQCQFTGPDIRHVVHLKNQVLDLADFVLQNTHLFDRVPTEQRRIAEAWQELKACVLSCQ